MKKYLTVLFLLTLSMPAFAVSYEEITEPKPPAYRTGLSELPEKKYIEEAVPVEKEYVQKEENDFDNTDLTYADLSIKKISSEVAKELGYDEKSVKNVLTTIASMSTLVGAGIGNPLIATGSMLGGNILGIMSQDTKALNYKYTRVTDADMIILVRKIEELQQTTVNLYYNYMTSRKMLGLLDRVVVQRKKNYDMAQDESREVIMVTDAYYRSAIDAQTKARADFMAKRAALEQFVGNETFVEFEKILAERDKEEEQ